jgi:hypothetical protein
VGRRARGSAPWSSSSRGHALESITWAAGGGRLPARGDEIRR